MHTLFKKLLCSAAALMLPIVGLGQDSASATESAAPPSAGDLSGVVFQDENEDGLMQEAEFPATGVIVDLLDAEGSFVARDLTDENGIYHFENLAVGIYFLRFEFSPGFGVRSRGIEIAGVSDAKGVIESDAKRVMGSGRPGGVVFIPIPVIHPDSLYSFTRLQLTNPANFKGEEVSPYSP